MTDWEEIAKRRERQALLSDSALQALWARFQMALWPEVEAILGAFALDKGGRILFNLANIQRAQRVGIAIQAVYRRSFQQKLIDFLVSTFRKLFRMNTSYARQMGNITQTAEELIIKRLL